MKLLQIYLRLKKKLLSDFFSFVERNKSKVWIHWNMSSDNFGFKALEHRFRVLGGIPVIFDDSKKVNLSHLFVDLYDKDYAKHPRIDDLMKMNHIKPHDFFPGYSDKPDITDETNLLQQGRYKEIQISCLRKVDVFANFLNLAIDDELVVKTPRWKRYGITAKGLWAALNENFWFRPATYLVTLLIGHFFQKIMDFIF